MEIASTAGKQQSKRFFLEKKKSFLPRRTRLAEGA
jgi:hypothetical protein